MAHLRGSGIVAVSGGRQRWWGPHLLSAQVFGHPGLRDLAGGGGALDYVSRGNPQTAFIDADPENAPERIWLFFGGNGALALDWLPVTTFAPESADAFVLMDYPGYGFSKGRPCPISIRASVDDLVASLCSKFGFAADEFSGRLGVIGHSLGAAVAMDTAARYGVRRVVLVSPFTTMKAMAARTVGTVFARGLRHHYDNIRSIESWQSTGAHPRAIEIFHGSNDELIPLSMAQELVSRFSKSIDLQVVQGADHNGILLQIKDQLLGCIARSG